MTLKQQVQQLRRLIEAERDGPISREHALALLQTLEAIARGVERSSATQAGIDSRLRAVEHSIIFRALRALGGEAQTFKRKLGAQLLRSPLHPLLATALGWQAQDRTGYSQWIESREQVPDLDTKLSYQPLICVLTPVFQPNLVWLKAAIDSVAAQSYSGYEHCLCVDGPVSAAVRRVLDESPVKWTELPAQQGISSALNAAGLLATGDYVTFLDQDDLLAPHALRFVVEALQAEPADVVYSDEDYIDPKGQRKQPNLKPDWSPELLDSCMYLGHLLVVRRSTIDLAGWFASAYDGAQDYDLALRLAGRNVSVRHVPKVLYHWRAHAASTAATASAKPYAQEAGRRALTQSLARRQAAIATIEDGPIAHSYRVRRDSDTRISFVICSRNAALLQRCLESLQKTAAGSEYVIVQHGTNPEMTRLLSSWNCKVVMFSGAFNFSLMCNRGAAAATSDHLVFLNDDVVALNPGWAKAMAAHLDRPEIGVVGAKLLYASGAIQHAGIVLEAGHIGRGLFRSDLWPWLDLARDVSAVTGACLGVRRSLFEDLGGFAKEFPVNYNDVDLCLRALQAGYRVIFDPAIELRHDECSTRSPGAPVAEQEIFYERWADILEKPDPFYHPELRSSEEIALRLS